MAALEAANKRLQERANRDRMTGFHTREAFFDRFRNIRRKSDNGVLLLIDVDHFKTISDTYGHLIGDRALKVIARAIQRSVRECDVVGRIGGEEFCVFLPAVSREQAASIAERLRAEVEQVVFWPRRGTRHPLSVSVGVAFCNGKCSLTQMMHRADLCLYDAKAKGRNMVVMDEPHEMTGASLPVSTSLHVENDSQLSIA